MKAHRVNRERIFALAQGMLSGRQERKWRAHVESCPACLQVLGEYRRLDGCLDEWNPPAEPSPWFDARVRAAVARWEATRPGAGFFGLAVNRWLAAPALAVLLVVAGIVIVRSPRPSISSARLTPTQAQAADQELKLYENLPVLEDYDMLSSFAVISELPKGATKVAD